MLDKNALELGALLGVLLLILLMKWGSKGGLRLWVTGNRDKTVANLNSLAPMIYASSMVAIAWIGIAFMIPSPWAFVVVFPVAAFILWKFGRQTWWKAGVFAAVFATLQSVVL